MLPCVCVCATITEIRMFGNYKQFLLPECTSPISWFSSSLFFTMKSMCFEWREMESKCSKKDRLPFFYPMDKNSSYKTFPKDEPEISATYPDNGINIYSRYRYYNRLFNQSDPSINSNRPVLVIPDHVVPWYFSLPRIVSENIKVPAEVGTQSSLVTIFAIWNMMMGTSLLCLPWAYHRAGLVGGTLAILLMTAISFFTATLVIKSPSLASVRVQEFTDLCALLLGGLVHKISQISSLSIIAGGCIVYWILLSNFLRHIISFVYQIRFLNTTADWNASSAVCSATYLEPTDSLSVQFYHILDIAVPGILLLLLGPIICLRSVNAFLRFNFVGTVAVFYLLGFVIFKAYHWGIHLSFDPTLNPASFVPLFSWNFPIYTGVLSLALFLHNLIITLLRAQRRPENNHRDLAIGYILVALTYLIIGTSIYIAFPLDKNCLQDNFLNNFESNDLFAFITRLFLMLQLTTLFPLLAYMLRTQVLSLFEKKPVSDDSYQLSRILMLNICLLTVCVFFSTCYPQIGTIIRYCGSFSAVILIFTLPSLAYIKARTIAKRPVGFLGLLGFTLLIIAGFANFLIQFIVQSW